MFFKSVLSAVLAARTALALPGQSVSKRDYVFNFQEETVRGLNIGGWLVLEPWITPSLFQQAPGAVDEYTLTRQLGPEAAYNLLRPHWDNFAKFEDFQWIAKAGFNTVRIPIGYWAFQKFDDDPYVQGAESYLDSAIGWARQTGLKVWIDLHGAPGSQNGFDNSGKRTDNLAFQQGNNVQDTLNVLQDISSKYARPKYQDVVVAIELLNEPLGPKLDMGNLKQFYRDGYGKMRQANTDTTVVIHDAFQKANSWNGFLSVSDNNAQHVVLDHHEYQVFNCDQVGWSTKQHRDFVCQNYDQYDDADKWVVVGEWTAAMTDCAPALNGQGRGSRYEGLYDGCGFTGSCAKFNFIDQWDDALRNDTRQYIEAQMEAYESKTRGWIFWNFKTESSAEWDAQRLLQAGIFPQPLTDRQFDIVCH